MRVVILGGRDYDLSKPHWDFLDKIYEKYPISEIIEGGASGADAGGKLWGLRKGVDITEFLCNWVKYSESAGPRRNQRMVDYLLWNPTKQRIAGIEFPGNNGTVDCHRRLTKANVHIFLYKGPASQKIT